GLVQLRGPAPPPAALRREPLPHARDRPHPDRAGTARDPAVARAGGGVPASVRRLAVPAVPDLAADRPAARGNVSLAVARGPGPDERGAAGAQQAPAGLAGQDPQRARRAAGARAVPGPALAPRWAARRLHLPAAPLAGPPLPVRRR